MMADKTKSDALGSGEHQEVGSSPTVGDTTPTSSTSSPQQQTYRFSQYAEAIANPLPELAVVPEEGTELEPFPRLSENDFDDTECSTRAVVEPDDLGDHRSAAVVYAGEEPTKWRKYRAAVIAALVILILALTGTVVGILVSNTKNKSWSDAASPSASTSSVATMTTGGSSVSASSTVAATGSSVPTPSQCADSSGFLTSVSFMGVKGAPGNGGWKTTYCGSASSGEDCCTCCHKNKDGCNSWAYVASSGFAGTRCALIVGWDTDDTKDSTCPAGHGAPVYFATDADSSSDVGSVGPCGVIDE